jgi:transcriptional regulator with XRE-family HTH domain
VYVFTIVFLYSVIKKRKSKNYRDEVFIAAIGSNIRKFRIAKKMTIEQLANECEVDYSQIQRMEKGQVNFTASSLVKIAYVLEINPRRFLPIIFPPPPTL